MAGTQFRSFTKAVTFAATPEALVTAAPDKFAHYVKIQAAVALTVIEDTDGAGGQTLVSIGDSWEYTAPPGRELDLSQIFINVANNGDAVNVIWIS